MKYLLVVLFINNGTPVFVDGYLPLQMGTAEECENRRVIMENYFQSNPFPPYILSCYEQQPTGQGT